MVNPPAAALLEWFLSFTDDRQVIVTVGELKRLQAQARREAADLRSAARRSDVPECDWCGVQVDGSPGSTRGWVVFAGARMSLALCPRCAEEVDMFIHAAWSARHDAEEHWESRRDRRRGTVAD